ncbi:hypothetical protein IAT38_002710 [Cryptococcus sp. DSM 104549]
MVAFYHLLHVAVCIYAGRLLQSTPPPVPQQDVPSPSAPFFLDPKPATILTGAAPLPKLNGSCVAAEDPAPDAYSNSSTVIIPVMSILPDLSTLVRHGSAPPPEESPNAWSTPTGNWESVIVLPTQTAAISAVAQVELSMVIEDSDSDSGKDDVQLLDPTSGSGDEDTPGELDQLEVIVPELAFDFEVCAEGDGVTVWLLGMACRAELAWNRALAWVDDQGGFDRFFACCLVVPVLVALARLGWRLTTSAVYGAVILTRWAYEQACSIKTGIRNSTARTVRRVQARVTDVLVERLVLADPARRHRFVKRAVELEEAEKVANAPETEAVKGLEAATSPSPVLAESPSSAPATTRPGTSAPPSPSPTRPGLLLVSDRVAQLGREVVVDGASPAEPATGLGSTLELPLANYVAVPVFSRVSGAVASGGSSASAALLTEADEEDVEKKLGCGQDVCAAAALTDLPETVHAAPINGHPVSSSTSPIAGLSKHVPLGANAKLEPATKDGEDDWEKPRVHGTKDKGKQRAVELAHSPCAPESSRQARQRARAWARLQALYSWESPDFDYETDSSLATLGSIEAADDQSPVIKAIGAHGGSGRARSGSVGSAGNDARDDQVDQHQIPLPPSPTMDALPEPVMATGSPSSGAEAVENWVGEGPVVVDGGVGHAAERTQEVEPQVQAAAGPVAGLINPPVFQLRDEAIPAVTEHVAVASSVAAPVITLANLLANPTVSPVRPPIAPATPAKPASASRALPAGTGRKARKPKTEEQKRAWKAKKRARQRAAAGASAVSEDPAGDGASDEDEDGEANVLASKSSVKVASANLFFSLLEAEEEEVPQGAAPGPESESVEKPVTAVASAAGAGSKATVVEAGEAEAAGEGEAVEGGAVGEGEVGVEGEVGAESEGWHEQPVKEAQEEGWMRVGKPKRAKREGR